jgi:putative hydrolase of the HAD superfamily
VRLWFESYDSRAVGKIASPEDNIRYICKKLGTPVEDSKVGKAARIRYDFTRRNLKPWSEAVPVISRLKALGYKVALISDCSAETPLSWENTDLAPLMDATVFSCTIGMKKPDPGMYLQATRQLGVSPEDCLYVGDGSSNELSGAAAVGMHPVMIRSPLETPDAHRIHEEKWEGPRIASLNEVLSLVSDDVVAP